MRNSDIFNSYAKIAEEKGLISLADDEVSSQPDAPKESSKMKKYKKSPYPRMGSDDLSTIEALYGVKPDNSIKYEFNIMEAAHPRPVVIGPSYDKMNALVENNIERQNIMSNIALKPNNGILDQNKYAKKELLMQLVRLANDLDNSGHDDLRVIADSCIADISIEKKKYKKADISDWLNSKKDWLEDKGHDLFQAVKGYGTGALIGGVLGGIIGAVAGEGVGAIPGFMYGVRLGGIAGGLTASIARTSPQVISVAKNAQDTSEQINDLVKKIPQGNPERTFLTGFQTELANLGNLSTQYNNLVSSIEETHPGSTSEDAQKAHAITTGLLTSMTNVSNLSKQFSDKVSRQVYQGFLFNSKLLTPAYELVSDDVEDVTDSLKSLSTAINNFKMTMSEATQNAKAAVEKTENDKPESDNQEQKPVNKNVNSNESPDEDETSQNDDEEDQDDSHQDNDAYSKIMNFLGRQPSQKEMDFFQSLPEFSKSEEK